MNCTLKPEALSSSSPSKSKIVVEKVRELPPKSLFHPAPVKQVKAIERQISQQVYVGNVPGSRLDSVACKEVPGDEPIVHFIHQLDPLKSVPGITVNKICHGCKIQITNECHMTAQGPLARLQVLKNKMDDQPTWETYLGEQKQTNVAIN